MSARTHFKQTAGKVLRETNVGSAFPRPSFIVALDSKCSLHEGFEMLLSNNILSAPVHDTTTNSYIGFLDIRDLVAFVVFVYDNQMVNNDSRLGDLILHGVGQMHTKSTDGVTVSYLCRRHKFVTVKETDNLEKVSKILSDYSIHRVPVVDEHGKVVNIISQSSVMQFLHSSCIGIGDYTSDEPISHLPSLGVSPVLTVGKNETVINTFRILDSKNKSGIALVDSTGRLVGTTTGKDLRPFMKSPTLAALNAPIFEHLQKIRSEMIDIKTPCISVFEKDNVARAVALLAVTRVHRVFVVDDEENFRPKKVISITDVLNHLLS